MQQRPPWGNRLKPELRRRRGYTVSEFALQRACEAR